MGRPSIWKKENPKNQGTSGKINPKVSSYRREKTSGLSNYKAKYYKLKSRRGARKAIMAITHRIAKAIFNIIKNGDRYQDLGEEYLSKPNRQRMLKNLAKKADELGVRLVPCDCWTSVERYHAYKTFIG